MEDVVRIAPSNPVHHLWCAYEQWHLGLAAYDQDEYGEAGRLLNESLALGRVMGSPWSIAFSLNFLGAAHVCLLCSKGYSIKDI